MDPENYSIVKDHRFTIPPVPGGPSAKDGARNEIPEADGGADRDRTDDLRLAKPALSQLSYSPISKNQQAGTCEQESDCLRLPDGGPGKI